MYYEKITLGERRGDIPGYFLLKQFFRFFPELPCPGILSNPFSSDDDNFIHINFHNDFGVALDRFRKTVESGLDPHMHDRTYEQRVTCRAGVFFRGDCCLHFNCILDELACRELEQTVPNGGTCLVLAPSSPNPQPILHPRW